MDVFQDEPDPSSEVQRNKTERLLSKLWIPGGTKESPEPAATLTTVSEIAYQRNRHFVNSLSLENIFRPQSLIPESRERPALLLVNLLGIPNYGIFELRGESINQASFRDRLTGIRVASLPSPAWDCYPQTWSLIGSNDILKTASDSNMQDVYLRRPDDAPTGNMKLELLLPILKGKVLGEGENDFELAWRNGNVSKLFPNRREHFVRADEAGLKFWSTVRAHFLTDSSDSFANESVLEIRRTTGRRESLGRWRFITRPTPGADVKLRLSRNVSTVGELPQVTVEIDLSQVEPPLDLRKVNLSVDGANVKNTAQFLQVPARLDQPGKYKFPYDDLVKELGANKVGSHKVEINAKTFFGDNESAVARLEIKPNPKPVKVKAAPILVHVGKVVLTFTNAAGGPLGEVTEFKDLRIDGVGVPWTRNQKLTPGTIVASGQASSKEVLVYEIMQGEHSVQVAVMVDGSQFVATGQIDVKKSGEVFKLKVGEN